MKTYRECITDAYKNKVAIGHFNISNLETLKGIIEAAKELNVPVIIGASEGERDFIGIKQIVALVKSYKEQGVPVFLNADHTYSFERVKEAVDAGFDSVIYDGAKLSLDENIKITKQCVDYANAKNPNVLIEAELGYIGTSSKLLDAIPEGASIGDKMLTTIDDAKRFVTETGIDLFAPAVGNIHGMLKFAPEPRLNIERIKEISEAVKIPLVLHGASGNSKEDIQNAILNGVAIVHINTEIRVAYKEALKKTLNESDEVAGYKLAEDAVLAVKNLVKEKLQFFSMNV
ncbi:MAG: class II fructose-bisphosphate aldolase [Candidatus Paceibacterota bacterium]